MTTDPDNPLVHLETFAWADGVPHIPSSALLLDLRHTLPALTDPVLLALTGHHPAVRHAVLATGGAVTALEEIVNQVAALYLHYADAKFLTVRVLIGSDHGRHRAVVLATEAAAVLAARGLPATLTHHADLPPYHGQPAAD